MLTGGGDLMKIMTIAQDHIQRPPAALWRFDDDRAVPCGLSTLTILSDCISGD